MAFSLKLCHIFYFINLDKKRKYTSNQCICQKKIITCYNKNNANTKHYYKIMSREQKFKCISQKEIVMSLLKKNAGVVGRREGQLLG